MNKFNREKVKKARIVDSILNILYFYKIKRKYRPIDIKNIKKIIIFEPGLIGDTIMLIPALKVIRKQIPNVNITLIGNHSSKIILGDQSLVDKFLEIKCPWYAYDYSLKNLLDMMKKIKEVNEEHFDLAIDFRGDIRNIFCLNFIKSSRKISYNRTGGAVLLTDIVKEDRISEHAIIDKINLLKQINFKKDLGCEYPELSISNDGMNFLRNFIEQNNLDGKKIIGIHPGASIKLREWGTEKYCELIEKISKDFPDICLLIFEGPKEEETVDSIIYNLKEKNVRYIHIRQSLKQYMWLISICNLLICNDSGAGHIASGYEIPSIVIFAQMNPEFCKPLNKNFIRTVSHEVDCKPCWQNKCKKENPICIKSISVDEVYGYFKHALNYI